MSVWHPSEADLNTYMHGEMEVAYQQRRRERCSREDFYDGFLAALRVLRSRSSFKPERWEAEPTDA